MQKNQGQTKEQQVKKQVEQGKALDQAAKELQRKLKKEEQQKKKLLAKEKKTQQIEEKTTEKVQKEQKKQKKDKKGVTEEYLNLVNSQNIVIGKQYHTPTAQESNILITSALPYVNNVPHLGNLIGCVLSADVFARFKRLHGDNTLYICGTDEYGAATVVKAMKDQMTPKQVCDKYNKIHFDIYKWFNISFDHFGRTSTQWHSKITQEIYESLNNNKFINKKTIKQAYCETDKMFLADRFIVGTCPQKDCQAEGAKGDQCDKCGKLLEDPMDLVNPQCYICHQTPVVRQTEHYFLQLEQIQKQLQEWVLDSAAKGDWSSNSISISKSWLKQGLKPKCITRDIEWGVSVPGEEKKVFYVWFDAPIGYISITANLLQQGYKDWWKNPDNVKLYQFMGKDNVPFHTVIFPASLIGTKQKWTLLHHISTTQYLKYEGGKFSKSQNLGVFGDNAQTTGISSDVWRYYLLINRPEKSDSDFYWTDLADKNNNELAANIGNLCNRVLDFCYNGYQKQIPQVTKEQISQDDLAFINNVYTSFDAYVKIMNAVGIKQGLRNVMSISSIANKYIQENEPWSPVNKQSGRSKIILGVVINFIRFLSALIQPYLPETSAKINFFLGLSERTERDSKLIGYLLDNATFVERFLTLTQDSKTMNQPVILFKRITKEQIAQFQAKYGTKKEQVEVKPKKQKTKKQKPEQKKQQTKVQETTETVPASN